MAMATALRRAAPPVARPRLARGSGTAAAKKCPIAASRGVSAIVRAYGDRRRNDDAPRGGGGWTNEFGDEYDAIDDDDGYFEERRAPAGRPDRGRAPDRGRRFDDDRRRGGFGRAEVGDLRRRGEGGRDGGRHDVRRRDDDGDWVEEILPCSGKAPGRVIGKGGATVNRLQEETGARIDIDRDNETCVVSGAAAAVAAAVPKIRLVMAEGDSAPGPWSDRGAAREIRRDGLGTGDFVERIVPCTGLGPGRVIGKRGATVNRLQEETGARIEVVAEDGQCFISGAPSEVEAAVAAVTRIIEEGDGYVPVGYDENGTFGGFDPSRNRGQGGDSSDARDDWVEETIPCRSPSAIGRVIGKGGSAVRVIEEETGTRIQVDKRMLECVVSGPPENVRLAVIKCKQIMQEGFGGAVLRINCTGFEGAIIGPGGKRVRSIAGQSRARVDIEKIGYGESECVIKGAPDAVAVAEAAVLQIIDEETARLGRVPERERGAGGWDDGARYDDRDEYGYDRGDYYDDPRGPGPARGGYEGDRRSRGGGYNDRYGGGRGGGRGGGGRGGRGRGGGRGARQNKNRGYDDGYAAPPERVRYYDERVEPPRDGGDGGSSRYSGGYGYE